MLVRFFLLVVVAPLLMTFMKNVEENFVFSFFFHIFAVI